MANHNKSWLVDYPPEIRLVVYDHFFSLMNVGIHAIEGYKRREGAYSDIALVTCPLVAYNDHRRQMSLNSNSQADTQSTGNGNVELQQPQYHHDRQQKMLSLLLTCKAVNAEATPFFYSSCDFETVDCHCWRGEKNRLPKFARQRIRNVICPILGQPGCIATLEKVFQMSEASGPKCPKSITLVPVVFATGLMEDSGPISGKRMLGHLLLVLFSTRYELKELRCWLVDRDRRLCHIVINSKYNAKVHVPYPLGVDTDMLLQELRTKCRVINKILFVFDDRVKIVHEFMVLSKRHDCWLQMREFQNIQR